MKKRKMERERSAKAMRKKVKMEMEKNTKGEEEKRRKDEKFVRLIQRRVLKAKKTTKTEDEEQQDQIQNNVPEYFIDAMKTIGHRRIAPIQKSSSFCVITGLFIRVPEREGVGVLVASFDAVIKRVAGVYE